jgi:hypothetical protein
MTAATKIVDNGDAIQVTAEIKSLDQLFEAPDFGPFSEQPRTSAVVDDILAHLRSRHMRDSILPRFAAPKPRHCEQSCHRT